MNVSLSGQHALVTGGTRGIGAAIVQELLEAGAEVTATGRDRRRLDELQREAGARGWRLRYECIDFGAAAEPETFAQRMAGTPFSVLINNAGINKIALAGSVDMADWDLIQRVNLRAPMLLCRAIAPGMAERGYGRIVNITSIFSHVSRSMRISYSSSKFGLAGLTRALALDYARHNVLVNALGPGVIDTELTRTAISEEERNTLMASIPMGRFGTEAEIAHIAVFLASPANGYLTGQNIMADGGFTSV